MPDYQPDQPVVCRQCGDRLDAVIRDGQIVVDKCQDCETKAVLAERNERNRDAYDWRNDGR